MTDPHTTRRLEVHAFLTARGWRPDDDGTGECWTYPASFGGERANDVGDTTPVVLQCYFTYAQGDRPVFGVLPAGNVRGSGCPEHDTRERLFPLTAAGTVDLAGLAAQLDELEPRARAHDVRALVACRYFGPC